MTTDGADDARRCHTAILDRQATAIIIPIRKNGRLWKVDCSAAIDRIETLCATRHYGRAFWKRWTRCYARSRIEARMRCLRLSVNASPHETLTARPPKSTSASY